MLVAARIRSISLFASTACDEPPIHRPGPVMTTPPYWRPQAELFNKVAEVTIFFWIAKVMATTVGETGADLLIFNLKFGLANTSYLMGAILLLGSGHDQYQHRVPADNSWPAGVRVIWPQADRRQRGLTETMPCMPASQ